MGPALHLAEFCVGWGSREVLTGLELRLEPGACLCIVGPGGSGKSSCARAIAAIVEGRAPSPAKLWWRGKIRADVEDCAYLGQLPRLRAAAGAESEPRAQQLQRTAASSAALLIFDEPLAGIQPAEAAQARAWLRALGEGGQTMIVVTHYLPLARELGDQLLLLVDGEVIEQGGAADFFARPRRQRTRDYIKWGA